MLLVLFVIDFYFISVALNEIHQKTGTYILPDYFWVNVLILNVILYVVWKAFIWIASKMMNI